MEGVLNTKTLTMIIILFLTLPGFAGEQVITFEDFFPSKPSKEQGCEYSYMFWSLKNKVYNQWIRVQSVELSILNKDQ